MKTRMLAIGHQFKILWAIIQLVAVLMVDMLVARQLSAKQFLHYSSMFFFSGMPNITVPMGINPASTIWRAFSYMRIAVPQPSFVVGSAPISFYGFSLASTNSASFSMMAPPVVNARVAVCPDSHVVHPAHTSALDRFWAVGNGASFHAQL